MTGKLQQINMQGKRKVNLAIPYANSRGCNNRTKKRCWEPNL